MPTLEYLNFQFYNQSLI